jgi:hypothetical protein
MATEDVEVIRRFYEKHLSREGHARLAAGSGHIDDEIAEDVVSVNFDEAPVTEPYRGHEGVREWARANADTVEDVWLELLEVRDVGDGWVISSAHIHGTIHGIDSTFVFWTAGHVRDGQLAYAKGFLREEDATAHAALRRSPASS